MAMDVVRHDGGDRHGLCVDVVAMIASWGRPCFWPSCSDRERCDAFGSCVAQAERYRLDDLPHNNQTAAAGTEDKPRNFGAFEAFDPGVNQTDDLDASDLELPAFELRWLQEDTGRIAWRWLIWADGRHRGFTENQVAGSGFGLVVFNRIPQLLTEACRDAFRSGLAAGRVEVRAERAAEMDLDRLPTRPVIFGCQWPDLGGDCFWPGFLVGLATTPILVLFALLLGFR